MPKYVVVAQSIASAVFYPGKAISIPCATDVGEILLTFRTNYRPGFEAPLPTFFYVEARGHASNINDANGRFLNTANEVSALIAFVTNADLGLLELELAFDCSDEAVEHDFMQRFVPEHPIIHVPGRPIEPEHISALLETLEKHPERERIQRTISHYVEALRKWNAGHEIMCLAHLYMGVESLTKAVLRRETTRQVTDNAGLAKMWGIDLKQLDSEVRRRIIFNGDTACFKQARSISDGFEHGFEAFQNLHQPARDTVAKVADYLRIAIIRLTDPSGVLEGLLLQTPWSRPRGPLKLSKIIRGTLLGNPHNLAESGNPYPFLVWNSTLKEVKFGADGRYGYVPNETFTPKLGDSVTLQLKAIEVWDDTVKTDEVVTPIIDNPIVTLTSGSEPGAARRSRVFEFFATVWRKFTSLIQNKAGGKIKD